jgi:hypothetical protein
MTITAWPCVFAWRWWGEVRINDPAAAKRFGLFQRAAGITSIDS